MQEGGQRFTRVHGCRFTAETRGGSLRSPQGFSQRRKGGAKEYMLAGGLTGSNHFLRQGSLALHASLYIPHFFVWMLRAKRGAAAPAKKDCTLKADRNL